MTTSRFLTVMAVVIIASSCFSMATVAEASLLYHAAKGGMAKRIATRGFSKRAMNPNARFGKGPYLGNSVKTVLKERPRAGSIAIFRKGRGFNNRVLDIRKLPYKKLGKLGGLRDGRGTVKNGIVGPKLGHRLGNYASRNNKVIAYNSAKAPGGTNYFIPKNLYNPKGRLIRPAGTVALK